MGSGNEQRMVYLMQNSLNLTASEIISTYVYKVGLSSAGTTDLSYSTAIGLFNSAINLVLISVTNFIAHRVFIKCKSRIRI